MRSSIVLLLLLAVPSCELVDNAARRPGEIKDAATPDPDRAEEILLEFFTLEFAQLRIADLVQNDLRTFERVAQPRPRLGDIVARFGEADRVAAEDLTGLGVREPCEVHYFGRLGLVTLAGRSDAEVYWVLIPERQR